MTSTVRHPSVLWAQRENVIYLTIELHDAQDAKIDLKEESIDFSNTTDDHAYAFHLDFFKPVKTEAKKSATGFKTLLLIDKKEDEWWPRLTKESHKLTFLKTDFDHWKDEDDSDNEDAGLPGMDFSQLGGMGGMGGMPDFSSLGGMGGMPDFGSMGDMPGGDSDDDGEDGADDDGADA
ncbi:p23 chaperone protein wos2 [Coemansia biformis]|uniref:P23 chaperone protein wos2 n=1 Tax=Coemansia biformis TaxID=1286918 RepID=A0A9W7YBS0_9FUNG|nr:p23 chaperone protein wos2 [Coemansia biformis]